MPTYDYECDACGHTFELFQSMTAAVKRKCPNCSKNKLQRLIGKGAAVLFKGGGFYETDYRSDSYKDAAKSDSKQASDSDIASSESGSSSGDKGADKKPASKPKKKTKSPAKKNSD